MAKLETRQAKVNRLKTFASSAHGIFVERINNYIKDKPHETPLNLNVTVATLAGTCLILYLFKDAPSGYCQEYLGVSKFAAASAIAAEVSADPEQQREVLDCTGIEIDLKGGSDPPQEHEFGYEFSYSLNDDGNKIVNIIRKDVNKEKWFEEITLNSQKITNAKHAANVESARIIARRRAKQKETATAATTIALAGEPTADLKTVRQLIVETNCKFINAEMQKMRKQTIKKARKKSSGGPRPKAHPKKKGKKPNGQSKNDTSTKPSQQPGSMQNQQRNDPGKKMKQKKKKCK